MGGCGGRIPFYLAIVCIWPAIFKAGKSFLLDVGSCPLLISESCDNELIRFVLFTSSGNYVLDPFNPELPHNFNSSMPLKIIIHGYGGWENDISTGNVTEAYHKIGYNIIRVDWSVLAELPCYVTAYVNTWHVGQCVAILAVSLAALGLIPQTIHVIGFSLGAHVSGFASNNLERALGVPFGRITGLDPALPFFATLKNEWKLDSSDATFVDVIHTNAGSFGKVEATGHVDFYINGGIMQPACINRTFPQLCSHYMAGTYFADTIRSYNLYYGFECGSMFEYIFGLCSFPNDNKVLMGENCHPQSRGTYFVKTEEYHYLQAVLF